MQSSPPRERERDHGDRHERPADEGLLRDRERGHGKEGDDRRSGAATERLEQRVPHVAAQEVRGARREEPYLLSIGRGIARG